MDGSECVNLSSDTQVSALLLPSMGWMKKLHHLIQAGIGKHWGEAFFCGATGKQRHHQKLLTNPHPRSSCLFHIINRWRSARLPSGAQTITPTGSLNSTRRSFSAEIQMRIHTCLISNMMNERFYGCRGDRSCCSEVHGPSGPRWQELPWRLLRKQLRRWCRL